MEVLQTSALPLGYGAGEGLVSIPKAAALASDYASARARGRFEGPGPGPAAVRADPHRQAVRVAGKRDRIGSCCAAMTSTQEEIDRSYSVSNEFFRLWLDEGMHYTSASYLTGEETLEEAQQNKCRILYDYAEITPDKLVLDIGCGWGSNLEYLASRGVKRAHGITLSTAQVEWIQQRNLPGVKAMLMDYKDYEPEEKYDALQSIEMIDHLCSPAQAREGKAVDIYREYFR